MNKNRKEETPKTEPIEFEASVDERAKEEQQLEQDRMATDLQDLEREIETLKKSIDETQNSYLRALADFDNYRRRQREETARLTSSAREDLILKLLPLVDNFDRTLEAAEAEHSYESLVQGIALTLKHTREMLVKEGLEPIEAVGQEFNPEFHEALMRVETTDYPENTVIDELEKGYTLNGKLLRPAKVRVAASN